MSPLSCSRRLDCLTCSSEIFLLSWLRRFLMVSLRDVGSGDLPSLFRWPLSVTRSEPMLWRLAFPSHCISLVSYQWQRKCVLTHIKQEFCYLFKSPKYCMLCTKDEVAIAIIIIHYITHVVIWSALPDKNTTSFISYCLAINVRCLRTTRYSPITVTCFGRIWKNYSPLLFGGCDSTIIASCIQLMIVHWLASNTPSQYFYGYIN